MAKNKKLTKTFVNMNNKRIYNKIKNHLDDSYFLEVLYYYIRRALIRTSFNLGEISGIKFNGRFLGHELELDFSVDYDTELKSLGLLLSIRAFMINQKFLDYCRNDEFLFYDLDSNFLMWDGHRAIVECLDDDDFRYIYNMILYFRDNNKLSDDLIRGFKEGTIRPEYRHLEEFCRAKASDPEYNGKSIIKHNAYLNADFQSFEIPESVDYIGDTAFAYCNNLDTLVLSGKVHFGYFPIIECNNLRQIIVPTELLDYYKQELPYYKDVITDHELEITTETPVEEVRPVDDIDESEIEDVYVDVPSADPYVEIDDGPEYEVEETVSVENESEPEADFSSIKTIFDKKASSYKYFWFLAIISLAKEHEVLAVAYKDIVTRMAAMAWPLVFEDGINLGKSDMMASYLSSVEKATKLIPVATSNVVENYIKMHYESQGIDRLLAPLLKNVPYRFLSPWVKYTTDAEVIAESKRRDFTGMYALDDDCIIINEDWWEYIQEHFDELCIFATQSFFDYVKQYNDAMKLLKLRTTGFSFIGKL
jgi:hypothetical protein